jgi:hypothetical protein
VGTAKSRSGPASCDDGNPCTQDIQDPSSNACTYTCRNPNLPDGSRCNVTGTCSGGTCSFCGDGKITNDEQCDPNAPGWSKTTCGSDCRRTVYRRCADSNDCPGDETCYVGICGKRCTSNDDPVCRTLPNNTTRCVAPNDNDGVCAIVCTNEPCPTGLSQGCVTVALDVARTNPVTICDGLGL